MVAVLGNKMKKFSAEYVQKLVQNIVCYSVILDQHKYVGGSAQIDDIHVEINGVDSNCYC